MYISGSIGLVILKKKDKLIYLLSDDHDNSLYCDNSKDNHLDIRKFLENELQEGNQIILEEVPRDGFSLQELWPNSPHTQDLKNLFLENSTINGIDIRPYLIPFSWEILEIEEDNTLGQMHIDKYFEKIDDFIKLKGKFFHKKFYPVFKQLKVKNSGLGKNLRYIKNKFDDIKNRINNKVPVIYYFKNEIDLLNEISLLSDMIMEFYTLLCVFTTVKKSIIHAGLFHSNNILNLLKNEYGFSVLFTNGNYSLPINHTNKYSSCTFIPGSKKFGFKD